MNRTKSRAAVLVAGLLATLALAAPATSSAALPGGTVMTADWDVRHSWVDYVTNPAWYLGLGQGTVTRSGGAASQSGYGRTAWRSPWTNYEYGTRFAAASDSTSGGVRTVQLTGGLRFVVSPHSIDVRLSDIRVVQDAGGNESIVLDAYYDPISGSPVTENDLDFADLVGDQPQLTSGGATVFNGGSNGSYRAGDAFGALVYNP
ncbi:MAG TPA: HtaA domain-containing protein [Conexibacter sp.]|nr:HtaA domain-containing protein [Conexibacter sp.]